MKVKNKKMFGTLFLTGCMLLAYISWMSLRPVDIVAVHEDGSSIDILVKNFPITSKGKINWWLKNEDSLKEKYNIPKPEQDGYFVIIFWLFGGGYKKTDGYDRLCFDDMKTEINCIDKDRVFSISNSKNRGTIFTVSDGEYRIKDGKIVKLKHE
ncbi:DUF943 family protein [Rosenbergiella sp. S61]|uniref:DUF943 family protein n=1 Tax=Rosenbergiella gaditana TaxID=2726987 RepID=A0ABS5T1B3_9GAMM|nr:DUF943 family protein [Rosenbergiella gaditana]MBT0725538.1 DUF943 family protein [Rosenbergiella gaditana]